MKSSEVNELADQLDEKQRLAILKLIDLKTESDMEKVLDKMDAKFSGIDAKFSGIDAKFNGLEAKFNGLKEGLEHKIDGQQKLLYSVLIAVLINLVKLFFQK